MSSQNHPTTSKAAVVPVAQPRIRWRVLWVGRDTAAFQWRMLASAVIAAFLSIVFYTLTLATLRWTMPLKLVGWACLLFSVIIIIWFARAAVIVVLQLGFKRILVLLLLLYVSTVVVMGILTPGSGGLGRWRVIAVEVISWPIKGISSAIRAVVDAPDAVSFAARGQRSPIQIPGIEWSEGVQPTPIVVTDGSTSPANTATLEETSSSAPSSDRTLRLGDIVQVHGTEGAALRARATPSTSAQIVARFSPNSRLRIIDGPQITEGRTWWKVKSEQDEGWCAAEFLTLAE